MLFMIITTNFIPERVKFAQSKKKSLLCSRNLRKSVRNQIEDKTYCLT